MAIIEGETGYFDLEEFVRAERCSVVHEGSIFNHIKTDWDGPGKEPKQSVENSWLNVLWRGHLLDVVLVTYTQRCYPSRHHWISISSYVMRLRSRRLALRQEYLTLRVDDESSAT